MSVLLNPADGVGLGVGAGVGIGVGAGGGLHPPLSPLLMSRSSLVSAASMQVVKPLHATCVAVFALTHLLPGLIAQVTLPDALALLTQTVLPWFGS